MFYTQDNHKSNHSKVNYLYNYAKRVNVAIIFQDQTSFSQIKTSGIQSPVSQSYIQTRLDFKNQKSSSRLNTQGIIA